MDQKGTRNVWLQEEEKHTHTLDNRSVYTGKHAKHACYIALRHRIKNVLKPQEHTDEHFKGH